MKDFFTSALYRKGQIAVGGFIAQLILLSVDGSLTLNDWLSAAAAGLAAAGVIAVANKAD